ncbi:MAG TPA: phenylacetate--CoA ligase family protein [Polyangiaceae bacterium]|nr:phenylacetate--CoA ligase family protein [Polyangiaceae bacterium]
MNLVRREQSRRARRAWQGFYESSIASLLERHQFSSPEANALELFQAVLREVPAYGKFLSTQGIAAESVRTFEDFARLPSTTKENYQRLHPLPQLCRGGELDACDMLAVSSGSSGTPTFWPRFVSDEVGSAMRFEQVLHDSFRADERRTLAVICFALGNWVGGMYTAACCRELAAKGYPLTLATPGNQKAEILRVLGSLRPHFDQVVLFGYPPFLKDVIDSARADGFDWTRCPTRLVLAGEVFSEEWRSLVCERLGVPDPALSSASLYGTADGGVLANESPLSVTIRRFLSEHPVPARELFGEARLPTLCQYDPLHRYFELDESELVFSGDGAVPLVRYKILDRGGVVPFERMLAFLHEHDFDPLERCPAPARERVRRLPFVFVFGRANFALSFYGANIYPENVSVGLEQPELADAVTGKFVMQLSHDSDLNASLDVSVELLPGGSPSAELARDISRSIQKHLERLNSEFAHYVPAEHRSPRVRLLGHGDPEYFPVGVKHRYTRT